MDDAEQLVESTLFVLISCICEKITCNISPNIRLTVCYDEEGENLALMILAIY